VATSGVLEGPQVLNTFKTCGSFVNKLANVIAHPKNISPETLTWLKKLENAVRLASGVQKAIDFVAAQLGVSKTINFTGFKFKVDGFTDIIIHSKGGKFVAIVEGVQVEKSMSELAGVIDQAATGKPVRILSCNDESSALALSLQTQKPFYASDGWVEITKTGEVFAENDFYQFSKGQRGAIGSGYTKASATGVDGVDFLRLGENTAEVTVKGTAKTLSHEIEQAKSIAKYLGGGEFTFIDYKQGIEGFLKKISGEKIPVSLKEYTTDQLKNVFRRIKDNADKIKVESLTDPQIIIGGNPNSVLYIETTNFTKQQVLDHISNSAANILPSNEIFEKVVFKSSDGHLFLIPLQ
jgi:hypothetical protein